MFFPTDKSISLKDLVQIFSLPSVAITGNNETVITGVATIETAASSDIVSYHNAKYKNILEQSKAGACLVTERNQPDVPNHIAAVVVDDPYYRLSQLLDFFYSNNGENGTELISANASLANTATVGANTTIAAGAVIDDNAIIGKNCFIGAGTYIGRGVQIGDNTAIHSNCSIICSTIGNSCLIHAGARIGQDGFGFAFFAGKHHKVKQIGYVAVGDEVEIGANSTIDRGAIGPTTIGNGTKIDNLVQIGHNVQIGNNCVIVAQTGIAGSTEIGDYAVIGGQAGIAGHLKIGKAVQIAAQSGVKDNLPDNMVVGGYPAVNIRDWHKQTIALKRLINKKNND